jgi:uncharacterized YigZ family protein
MFSHLPGRPEDRVRGDPQSVVNEQTENDVYYTLGRTARFETKVKGSRFIGYAAPAVSGEIAAKLVESMQRQFHDARHHCFAFRVGLGRNALYRISDGGEPSGTAGRPILEAIDRRNLTDTVCVVTRYFGGTKLGTGGLARAYGECAAGTLDNGEITEHHISVTVRILFGCELTGRVMTLIQKTGCRIEKGDFQAQTRIHLRIRKSVEERFIQDLINVTSGKIQFLSEDVPMEA